MSDRHEFCVYSVYAARKLQLSCDSGLYVPRTVGDILAAAASLRSSMVMMGSSMVAVPIPFKSCFRSLEADIVALAREIRLTQADSQFTGTLFVGISGGASYRHFLGR